MEGSRVEKSGRGIGEVCWIDGVLMGENGGERGGEGRRKVKVKVKGDEVSNWMVMCTLAGAGGGWGGRNPGLGVDGLCEMCASRSLRYSKYRVKPALLRVSTLQNTPHY